jgi:hypothetical protein
LKWPYPGIEPAVARFECWIVLNEGRVAMNSNKRSESDQLIRDEALARRIGKVLEHAPLGAGADCPDAEHIAAYFERTLQPDEITHCENHFARCIQCRKTLALLAASVETPLAVRDPTLAAERVGATVAVADSATRIARPSRSNWFDWRLRWLAPAVGVAAVLVVWFAMRSPLSTPNRNASGTLIAQAPKSDLRPIPQQAAPDQLATGTPKLKSEADAAALADRANGNSLPKARSRNDTSGGTANDAFEARARAAADQAKQNAASASDAPQGSGTASGGVLAATPQPAPVPPSPAPEPQSLLAGRVVGGSGGPAPTSQSVVATEEAPVVTSKSIAPRSATPRASAAVDAITRSENSAAQQSAADNNPAARSVANAPLNGRNFSALSIQNAPGKFAVQLKPPTGPILWRAGVGGLIERSVDAGSTWVPQTSPLQEDWIAGAAVSDRVVWLAGRKGTVARTTDGEHWTQVAPPSRATIATGMPPDWIAVTATDAQNATITSADHHQYVTQDGGKTWRAQ